MVGALRLSRGIVLWLKPLGCTEHWRVALGWGKVVVTVVGQGRGCDGVWLVRRLAGKRGSSWRTTTALGRKEMERTTRVRECRTRVKG